MIFGHPTLFWPILLIILGLLALSTNLGIVSASIWAWWPILLVVFGIYLIILRGRKKSVLSYLVWYGILKRIVKSDDVQDKFKKVMDIAEGVFEKKLEKWHKKYSKKEK